MAKIIKVDVVPLHLPLREPLVESGGTFSCFDHVLVKIYSDAGTIGVGEVECYPSFERIGAETQAGVVAILNQYLVPAVLGESPFNINAVWQRMDKAVVGYLRVKAAIDNALYDLIGRSLGIPVYDLLGGKVRDGYVVEGTGYGISLEAPEVMAAKARRAVERGYRQLELKAGDPDPAKDVERLHRVREAIGGEIPIKIDFNGFYDTKTAIRVIRQMEPLGVQWIEQPAKYWDIDGLAAVKANVSTTIIADEPVNDEHDMMSLVRARATDAIHIKPTIKGGLTGAMRIAAVAEAAGISIVPGTSAPSGVGMAAAQAFIAASASLSGGAHGSPLDILVEDIVTEPIPADSTYVRIGAKPGLGFELNERAVEKYRVG